MLGPRLDTLLARILHLHRWGPCKWDRERERYMSTCLVCGKRGRC